MKPFASTKPALSGPLFYATVEATEEAVVNAMVAAETLIELRRMTREEWDRWTRGSAIRRAGYAGFKRNVAVAMGNWSAAEVAEGNWLASVDDVPEDALAVLRDAIEHDEPLVGEHAARALKQVR